MTTAMAAPTNPSIPGNIVSASNASPIVITTAAAHGLTNGQSGVTVAGVTGNTAANGTWTVTALTPTTFSLNGSTGNGVGSGGTVAFTSAVLFAATTGPTRLLYLSMTNNDASPRNLALFDSAGGSSGAPTWISPAIAPGATYTCTNADLGLSGRVLNQGCIACSVTSQPNTTGGGPSNVPSVQLGTSANFSAWLQAVNP